MALWLPELLADVRYEKGLSQTSPLSSAHPELVEGTRAFVSNYERGERRFGLVDFVLIARALGVEPTEVLRWLD